jgi:hypothetical protein
MVRAIDWRETRTFVTESIQFSDDSLPIASQLNAKFGVILDTCVIHLPASKITKNNALEGHINKLTRLSCTPPLPQVSLDGLRNTRSIT